MRKRIAIFLPLIATILLGCAPAISQTIYSQPYDPAGGLYHSSRWDPDGSDWDQYVWDNFRLANTSEITEIRWRGAFDPTYNGSGGPVRNFRIEFYGSAALNTEPDVTHPPLRRILAGGDANQTPAGTVNGVPIYEYSITLGTPFRAVQWKKYWIQIEAYQWGVPDWSLLKATGGDNVHFRGMGGSGINYTFISGDTAFTLNGTALSSAPCDMDGDGHSDLVVFRPSDGNWYTLSSLTNTMEILHWGAQGDVVVPGDYDIDGRTDTAVYRYSSGWWYVAGSGGGLIQMPFGALWTDIPVQADYDTDGKTDIAVFRPSTGVWYLQQSTAGFTARQFGMSGDRPVPGDYDGDGTADLAVYRPSTGIWYLMRSTFGFAAMQFGIESDKVVPADYNGDGKTDVAVYRAGAQSYWYINLPSGLTWKAWGTAGDIPTPADYDGDRKTDISVFRPSNGYWYHVYSSDGGTAALQFGMNGDVPVAASYIPVQ